MSRRVLVCQVALRKMSKATCDRIAALFGGVYSCPQPDSYIYRFPNRKSALAFDDQCGDAAYIFNLRYTRKRRSEMTIDGKITYFD